MADITRAEVASLIAEDYSAQVIKAATVGSTVLQAFPNVNMGTKTTHLPVLATLPTASWVSDVDNTGIKPTSQVTWADQTLVAEEIAVIIPIHENTLDDATEDILGQIADLGGQAIAKALDEAVLFGVNKPASWTSLDLHAAAVAQGNVFEVVDGPASSSDLYGSGIKAAKSIAQLGFRPDTMIADLGLMFDLENIRGTDGHPILTDTQNVRPFRSTYWNENAAWRPDQATELVVDSSTVRIGVRQDVTVKFLDQGPVGGISLAERDMVALRFKARFAYVLGRVATPRSTTRAYGVAAVVPDVTP